MKTEAHIRYKNKEGKIIPGATTVVGLLNKPQLIIWANRLGLQGIDSTAYRDGAARMGILAHDYILCHHKGIKPDLTDYSKVEIDAAENSFLSYLEWLKGHKLEPLLLETPLVSEEYQFGGTPDCLCMLDGEIALIDYKTGGIYKEAYYQTCAYRQLLVENERRVPNKIIILGIPRTPDESFKTEVYTEFDTGWEIFKHLLSIYYLQKETK